jgi:hypothetical protein
VSGRDLVLKARHYQRKDDATRRIAERAQRGIGQAIVRALRHFRDSLTARDIAERLRGAGQLTPQGAADAIELGRLSDGLRVAFERIAGTFDAAARLGASRFHRAVLGQRRDMRKDTTGVGAAYAFDRFTPEVQAAVRALQDAFITSLSDEARSQVFSVIVQAQIDGLQPEEIGARIRQVVGLSPSQTQAVVNFERLLVQGDRSVLTRSLRDPRFEQELVAMLSRRQPDRALIDRMVQAYADRHLDARARTIAQTESVNAANIGLHESYSQAIDRGLFPHAAVRRFWQVAIDEKTCVICRGIPDRNPDGVGVDQAFDTALGPILDPSVHPNCRCSVRYVTDLDMLDAGLYAGESDEWSGVGGYAG